jgi:hypothetical protein
MRIYLCDKMHPKKVKMKKTDFEVKPQVYLLLIFTFLGAFAIREYLHFYKQHKFPDFSDT